MMVLMPTRRVFLASASIAGLGGMISLSGKAVAFGLDSLIGGDSGSGESETFIKHVTYGTRSLMLSLSEMHLAIEKKEGADQLIAAANELKSGGMSEDNWKMSAEAIDNNPLDTESLAAAQKAKAGSHVGKGFLLGVFALFWDQKAVTSGQKVISSVGSGGVMSILGGASGAVMVAKSAVTVLPDHISLSSDIMSTASNYMASNDIAKPGKNEANKIAKDMFSDDTSEVDFSSFG